MKRAVCLLLVLSLTLIFLLAGCSKKENDESSSSAPENSSSETALPEPSSSEPAVVMGKIVNVDEGSYVNVRASASMEGEILGKALPGEEYALAADGSEGDWVKISYHDAPAYIHKDYITAEGDSVSSEPEPSSSEG